MATERNKAKALAALLECNSIRSAAKKAGIGERTIHRFLSDEAFVRDYRNARRQVVEFAITSLQAAAGDAVSALKRNLNCGSAPAEIRAAAVILENAYRGIEVVDLLERLEAIENEITGQT